MNTYDVEIEITHDVKIRVKEGVDREQEVKSFSSTMFKVDSFEALIKAAATHYALFGTPLECTGDIFEILDSSVDSTQAWLYEDGGEIEI